MIQSFRPGVRRVASRSARFRPVVQCLEGRRLLSLGAGAKITLVFTDTSTPKPTYHYALTLTDSGTTTLGTFWLAWVPGADFLPSVPTAVTDPAGWSHSLSGENTTDNGNSIRWVASDGARVSAGKTLTGFAFASADSPAVLAGKSPSHPGSDTLTSFVYSSGPFSDGGLSFKVSGLKTSSGPVATTVSSPMSTTVAVGTALKLAAKVTSSDLTDPYTGTAMVTENDEVVGTASLGADGAIVFTSASGKIPVGEHRYQFVYSGDAKHASGASAVFKVKVEKAKSETSLKVSGTAVFAGQALTLTAGVLAVTAAAKGMPREGTVTFKDGAAVLGTAKIAGNAATFKIAHPAVGTHNYGAVYGGGVNFVASTSVAKTVAVAKNTPRLALKAAPTVKVGVPIRLTASFSGAAPGTAVPSGTVTFREGQTVIGTGKIAPDSTAFIVATLRTAGTHTFTATYAGDKNTVAPAAATAKVVATAG